MEEKSKLTIISIKIPMEQLKQLDSLVQQGLYASRSEAIRAAVRRLLEEYERMKWEGYSVMKLRRSKREGEKE